MATSSSKVNLLSHFCTLKYCKDGSLRSPLLPLLGELDIRVHWVFCRKFNSEQFLCEAFLCIIGIFGSIQYFIWSKGLINIFEIIFPSNYYCYEVNKRAIRCNFLWGTICTKLFFWYLASFSRKEGTLWVAAITLHAKYSFLRCGSLLPSPFPLCETHIPICYGSVIPNFFSIRLCSMMDFYIHSVISQKVTFSENFIRTKFILHKIFFRMSILLSNKTIIRYFTLRCAEPLNMFALFFSQC